MRIWLKLKFTKRPRRNMINSVNKDKLSSEIYMIKDNQLVQSRKNFNNLRLTFKKKRKLSLNQNSRNFSFCKDSLLFASIL